MTTTNATHRDQFTPAQPVKLRALRRMKVLALAALVLAAVVYVVTYLAGPSGWVGYLNAAAEASMVGALADWFAVTALFKHPLGLPIPHTAIIPTRKSALGSALSDFVGTNFLAENVVREKLATVRITERAGDWLAKQHNADRVTAELASVLRGLATVLRDEDVQAVMEQAVLRRLVNQPWGPPVGKILERVFADGSHHRLVDLLTDQTYAWVRDNHETVLGVVSERSPSWSPKFVDEILADRIYTELLAFSWAVKVDVNHPMRQALDRFLIEFASDLQSDPEVMQRAEKVKHQVLEHPEVQGLISSAWGNAKRMLLDAAEDPSSELRKRVAEGIVGLGKRLQGDPELQSKVEGWVGETAGYIVRNYAEEISTLISDTVERWDPDETSRKIELQVGKDLQFIRINGTVVGALAGLVIHAVTQLF